MTEPSLLKPPKRKMSVVENVLCIGIALGFVAWLWHHWPNDAVKRDTFLYLTAIIVLGVQGLYRGAKRLLRKKPPE